VEVPQSAPQKAGYSLIAAIRGVPDIQWSSWRLVVRADDDGSHAVDGLRRPGIDGKLRTV
jgi:hypothetical protein